MGSGGSGESLRLTLESAERGIVLCETLYASEFALLAFLEEKFSESLMGDTGWACRS